MLRHHIQRWKVPARALRSDQERRETRESSACSILAESGFVFTCGIPMTAVVSIYSVE
jgi:hypothetical protein